jgi:hypothetical protein
MVKDFVPVRTSISTGIIIKPTILERPKYPVPQVSWSLPEYTASIQHYSGSDTIYGFSSDNGGVYLNQTSSFTQSFNGPTGSVNIIHNDNREFYNGELNGALIIATTQSLLNNPLLEPKYRESIGDLQNLNATRTSTQIISGSDLQSGSVIFNQSNLTSPYYSTTTGIYTPQLNVQSSIVVTINFTFINSFDGFIRFNFKEDGNYIDGMAMPIPISPATVTQTFSIPNWNIKPGSNYTLDYSFAEQTGVNLTGSINTASTYKITVNNLSAQSLYYLDPNVYTQQNFPGDIGQFDDYNAIYGNVYSNRVSNKYFDVDYSNGISLPVNLDLIISSSAIYAQVQPSNYTLKRHINPRYVGSKLYGANINRFTSGDFSYANKPVIERYTDYVAQYDYVAQGANSVVHILSLIDIDGNKIALNGNTNFNYGMVKTIFPPSSSISLVDLTTNSAGLNTSGSAVVSSSVDENNIYIYGAITKTDTGLLVPTNFNPYIDIYEIARKAGLI